MIVFHDIVKHSRNLEVNVNEFWKEIKRKHKVIEIVQDWNQGSCGLGIILN